MSAMDKTADLAGPGISTYEEVEKILPIDYESLLTPMETMKAVYAVKRYIEDNLCKELNLTMVQVPLIVDVETGAQQLLYSVEGLRVYDVDWAPATGSGPFADVPDDHVFAGEVASLRDWDGLAAAARCQVPVLHIAAAIPACPPGQLRDAIPDVVTGQTVGAGHFNMLEVPDQVNSMIEGFLAHYVPGD